MTRRRLVWTAVAALAAISLAVLGSVAADAPQAQTDPRVPVAQPAEARLAPTEPVPMLRAHVVVFRLPLDAAHAVDLDAKALAKEAATSKALFGALQRLGTPTLSCNFDHLLAADGRQEMFADVSQDVPYVSGAQDSKVTVSRSKVGVRAKAQATLPSFGNGQEAYVGLELKITDVSPSKVEVAPAVTSPTFGLAEVSLYGPVKLGEPTVVVSFANGGDYCDQGAAYVTLLTVSKEP